MLGQLSTNGERGSVVRLGVNRGRWLDATENNVNHDVANRLSEYVDDELSALDRSLVFERFASVCCMRGDARRFP
jgi:hypothetical protein